MIKAFPYSQMLVGSLPFLDPQAALDFIRSRPQIMPCLPELPLKDHRELMISKATQALSSKWQGFSPEEYSTLFAFQQAEVDKKLTILKVQLCGPLTCAIYSPQLGTVSSEALEHAISACARQIRWLAETLRDRVARLLIVLDEPGFSRFAELPSAAQAIIRDGFTYLSVAAHEERATLGVHCCGKLSRTFFELPVELLSFDWVQFGTSDERALILPALRAAHAHGITLVPGVFPAIAPASIPAALSRGNEALREFELILARERPQTLYSATCGHGAATQEWIEALYS